MKIKLIIDPWAGKGKGWRFLPRIVKILGKDNLLDVSLTKGPMGALLFAREAAQKQYDIMVAGCGDGTLNEVINGILQVRKDLPLGFIPLGMSNTAAWGLGLPQDPIKACEIILRRKTKKIDLGKATKPILRYFLSAVDYGYSASLIHRVESKFKLKMLLGKYLYWIYGYPEVFRYKFPCLTVKTDDIIHKCYVVILCNSGFYMGKLKMASKAKIDDGYLDVCIYKKGGAFNTMRYFYSGLLLNKLDTFPDVEFIRAKKINIASSEKVPGQMDGEPFGFTPAEIEVVPQILPMIAP